jgi:hypothetical protein
MHARPGELEQALGLSCFAPVGNVLHQRFVRVDRCLLLIVPPIRRAEPEAIVELLGPDFGQCLERRQHAKEIIRRCRLGRSPPFHVVREVHPDRLSVDIPVELVDDKREGLVFDHELVAVLSFAEEHRIKVACQDGQRVWLIRIDDENAVEQRHPITQVGKRGGSGGGRR